MIRYFVPEGESSMANIFQFKISLRDIIPSIWRRIQISEACTFWDLHVAIQEAMGWEDCHVHQFLLKDPQPGLKIYIGMPDDELDEHAVLPGWEFQCSDYLGLRANHRMSYLYDDADNWEHLLELEGSYPKDKIKYPRCLEGRRACPPENVGGVFSYKHYLDVLSDSNHPEYSEVFAWKGAFEAENFNSKKIKFSDPLERLKKLRIPEL